ncbi:MAG: NADH-quinone oxidoreductase subunit NuoK [Candidatus Acidulodesulfobacterium ferriphilum]|uniref:NADH-quinone oxidoreductase subunit K n=1 Tax=Candidatus Acidulodesulfobacterium ferriphilum TaxID=2597223 RepID=A0A519BCQ6_9DELT|nr:NADH-quinone oxidoreductase subunit NuoK [Deltaproteobacteria bacterium]MCL5892266.1 NADH-quinone oxidoreductase subunit NuoK [Deltaproteobacteria bacterium]RZD15034.1 MAG: NADH-quinone oxidoreductase subunit NuoK [Candidatus Acidulodesulfobacterium ferriphilum]
MSINGYLIVAGIIFCIGMLGVLMRKNLIVIFMSLELMFNAANLGFVAVSNYLNLIDGDIFVIFVMVVAAAEAAIALGIAVAFYREKGTVDIDKANELKL